MSLIYSLHPQPWVVHCITTPSGSLHHNLELFITSQPRVVHCITGPSCSLHHNLKLFIIFNYLWEIWSRVYIPHFFFQSVLWHSKPTSFRRSEPIAHIYSLHHNPELFITSQPRVVHYVTTLSYSLHHNPKLFITSTTLSYSLHPQPWDAHCIHSLKLLITCTFSIPCHPLCVELFLSLVQQSQVLSLPRHVFR